MRKEVSSGKVLGKSFTTPLIFSASFLDEALLHHILLPHHVLDKHMELCDCGPNSVKPWTKINPSSLEAAFVSICHSNEESKDNRAQIKFHSFYMTLWLSQHHLIKGLLTNSEKSIKYHLQNIKIYLSVCDYLWNTDFIFLFLLFIVIPTPEFYLLCSCSNF